MIAVAVAALFVVSVLAVVALAVCGALWAWTGWRDAVEIRRTHRAAGRIGGDR